MDPSGKELSGYVLSISGSEFTYYGLTSMEGTVDDVSIKLVNGRPGIMINMTATDFTGDTP